MNKFPFQTLLQFQRRLIHYCTWRTRSVLDPVAVEVQTCKLQHTDKIQAVVSIIDWLPDMLLIPLYLVYV